MTGQGVGVAEVVVGVAVLLAATGALVVPKRLASAVSFLVFGVLLSVLWALAGAPDVALAEAALGAGVTGVLFIETVTRSRRDGSRDQSPPEGTTSLTRRRPSRHRLLGIAATILGGLTLATALTPALWRSAAPLAGAAPGLAEPVTEALPRTGVDHGVTGVLLNLRSYDTLLEVAVLLVAVLAVLAVSGPDATEEEPEGHPASPALAPLQRAATAVLVPVLVLLAGWILFAGSTTTGGAFQAGAVLAAVLLLLHLAGRPVLSWSAAGSTARTAIAVTVGLLAFVAVSLLGPFQGRAWLELDPSVAGVVIVLLEALLTVSIGASLALIALAIRAPRQGGAR
ncbi:hydrogenase subunit MbhD domain-containing protein [Ornithinimicrobium sp. Y1694]|uniref:hydrogenase subunit MbhD domain-containing protein n=1 Tax=Ornithinimicrobium sp. Y1694 TaxID=3418590 RepID=UPI003CE9476B